MRVLVTGGAGFIGSHIADLLLKRGYEVFIVDNLSAGRRSNIPEGVSLTVKSVAEMSGEDINGFDAVVHCAAQVSTFRSVDHPEEDFHSNAFGTFRLLEIIRRNNPTALFVYTSSRSVHGNIPEPHVATEESAYDPSTFYNVHKIYGEMLCKIYSQLYGMKFVILRPSNIYGPRQPYWMQGWYNFISFWIKLGLEGKDIPIYGTGEQVRDYVYVTDTAQAYLLSLEKPDAVGETFLLPSGRGVNLNELADMIIELTGSRSKKVYFPPRKGDIMRFVGSYMKAKKILDWAPRVCLEDGLNEEVAWMKNEQGKK